MSKSCSTDYPFESAEEAYDFIEHVHPVLRQCGRHLLQQRDTAVAPAGFGSLSTKREQGGTRRNGRIPHFLHTDQVIMVPVSLRRMPHMDLPSCLRSALLAALTGLAACAGDPAPEQPAFYRSMASADAQVDGPAAAQSSDLRLPPATTASAPSSVDPELMRLANWNRRAAWRRATSSTASAGRPFQQAPRRRRLRLRRRRGGERQRPATTRSPRPSPARGDSPAAPRQHAQCRDANAHGHRRGLFAAVEIQGVLGA